MWAKKLNFLQEHLIIDPEGTPLSSVVPSGQHNNCLFASIGMSSIGEEGIRNAVVHIEDPKFHVSILVYYVTKFLLMQCNMRLLNCIVETFFVTPYTGVYLILLLLFQLIFSVNYNQRSLCCIHYISCCRQLVEYYNWIKY